MIENTIAPVGELLDRKIVSRPLPKDDKYCIWFNKNRDLIIRSGGLVHLPNPFGAPTQTMMMIGDFSIEKCTQTGFVFANPRLTARAAKPFFDVFMRDYFEQVENSFDKRRKLSYLSVGKRLCGVMPSGGRLLEIGCGSGSLMQVLREEFGLNVEGNEVSMAALPYHKRRKQIVYNCAVEDMKVDEPYDGIFLWSVADHFADPKIVFDKCYDLLCDNGLLFIGNVNIDGFDIATLSTDSPVFAPPGRVNFYNKLSLRLQLEMSNFVVEEQSTVGELDVAIVSEYWCNGGQNGRASFLEKLVLDDGYANERIKFQGYLMANGLSGYQTVLARKA